MLIEKPWGYENVWIKTDKYVGKVLHVNKGEKLSVQYHEVKDEAMFVMSGTACVSVDGEVLRLTYGESVHIKPGVVHSIEAMESDVDILEVSTPELDDIVRLEDKYGRI